VVEAFARSHKRAIKCSGESINLKSITGALFYLKLKSAVKVTSSLPKMMKQYHNPQKRLTRHAQLHEE